MEELQAIMDKYKGVVYEEELSTFRGLIHFSRRFYTDVAEIYDIFTRVRTEGNSEIGFQPNDAAILGLLVRAWKLLKEIVRYYQQNNGDMVAQLDRQFIESVITASYLMKGDDARIEDYRKCGYKSRIQMLSDERDGHPFFQSPAGLRLISSIQKKLHKDGFDEDSFTDQIRHKWKVGGKSFRDILADVHFDISYKYIYGLPSEALHGSWTDSLDYHLDELEQGRYSVQPYSIPVDIRAITPHLLFANSAFQKWLIRIGVDEDLFQEIFDWISRVNGFLFKSFDAVFSDDITIEDVDENPGKDTLLYQNYVVNELWNSAGWCGVFYATTRGEPPLLALWFKSETHAKQIFEGFNRRVGKRDLYDELHVSIMMNEVLENEFSYFVTLSSNPSNTHERFRDLGIKLDREKCIVTGRRHELISKKDSQNLLVFLRAYLESGIYYIAPYTDQTGFMHKYRIRKKELKFRDFATQPLLFRE